jgi:hypothetical protein
MSILLGESGEGRPVVDGPGEAVAEAPPTIWASKNIGTEAGWMPAKVLENMRAMVTAGLAKLVELVNQ